MDKTFKTGDIVNLKSGSLDMTVIKILDDREILVSYFGTKAQMGLMSYTSSGLEEIRTSYPKECLNKKG